MAAIYKIKLVSHWINYTEEQVKQMIEDAIKEKERDKGNEIQIKVEKQN